LNEVASDNFSLAMESCINTGAIVSTVSGTVYLGSILGQRQHAAQKNITVTNVYATNESYSPNGTPTAVGMTNGVTGTVTMVNESDITKNCAYFNNVLVKADEWSITEATPELTIFAEDPLGAPEVVGNIDWYTGLSETDFVICDNGDNALDVEELYGFAYLVDEGITFGGRTVSLGGNVTVNADAPIPDGGQDAWTTYLSEHTDVRTWNPIGSRTNEFAGTFNGLNSETQEIYTISGIYVNSTEVGAGLFASAKEASVIHNVKLENSYITTTQGYAGSIVGAAGGSIENVYSNAVVVSSNSYAGGIVGQLCGSGDVAITNCWYDGDLTAKNNAGGIIGLFTSGNGTVTNCSNTAQITCTDEAGRIGGLVGRFFRSTIRFDTNSTVPANFKLAVNGFLNTGDMVAEIDSAKSMVGSVIGNVQHIAKENFTLTDVYTTNESYVYDGESKYLGVTGKNSGVTGSAIYVDESDITGVCSYYNNVLVKDEDWVPTATTPALAIFAEAISTEVPEGVSVDWYTGLDATSYTICDEETNEENVAELYGMAYLANAGIDFDEMTVKLANSVTVNSATISELSATDRAALKQWEPMGTAEVPFAGTFDGGLNTISGLCAETTTTYTGLFAALGEGSAVQNLKLQNSYFGSTANYTGSIAGLSGGSLENIYSDATVAGAGHAAGMVGLVTNENTEKTSISNCWFAGSVSATADYAGGLVGFVSYGVVDITDCLNTADITVTKSIKRVGGLIGGMLTETSDITVTMSNCMNVGALKNCNQSTDSWLGSILGRKNGLTKFTMTNVYGTNDSYHKAVGGTSIPTGTYGQVNKNDMLGQAAYYTVSGLGFDNESNWVIVEGTTPQLKLFADSNAVLDIPTLDEGANVDWYEGIADSYTIMTAEELYGFSYLSNLGMMFEEKTVKLGANIDLNEGWTASATPEAAKQWTPVGVDARPFSGTFDGQNYSISGAYVDASVDYLGFFGVTGYYSSIQNFRILNSYFNQQIVDSDSTGFTASVAGEIRGNMSNVYSNAIVKSNNIQIGGMVARVKTLASFKNPINITNCWFDGTVIGGESGRYLGGVVATVVRGTCNLENILFTGTIDSSYVPEYEEETDTYKATYIGGVVAETKANSMTLNMKSVVSAGKITGTHNHSLTHGLIGRVRSKINNDNTTSATAENATLTFDNVFLTRDCYQTAYGTGVETGTKIITPAETDEGGNIITEAVTETITSAVNVTGGIIRTTGDDRLIGYIPQSYVQEVVVDENTTEKQPVSESLDFTSAWTLRTDGVPIPTTLKDVVASTLIVSDMDAAVLAKEIGLDYWNASAKITDAESYGAGNYLVTYTTTDSKTYAGYLTKLEGLGFTKYADNSSSNMDDDGVQSATYCKETSSEWVLNITYVKNESKIYISINSDKNSVDDNLKPVTTTGTGTISLSMLELVNTVDSEGNESRDYGNSFVFQLPNGHFIVSDGGRIDNAAKLLAYMKDLAGETEGVQNPIYIDAWVISHYHGDHAGALTAFFEHPDFIEGVYVEAIYASEPSTYALDYWEYKVGVVNNTLRSAMRVTKADGVSKPDVYQLHMGQRFYFNGITMDVIDTQEQHPVATWGDGNVPDKFNTSSTNVLFTFADANGVTKKTLIGGDATNVNMEYIMMAFGSNNETLANVDVFVTYHHGHNTTATYGQTEVNGLTVRGIANKNWADFLLKNTNNSDQKFDVLLFPYYKVYELTLIGTEYVDEVGSKAYPYNIGEINQYMIDHSDAYYTYGYDDITGKTESDSHGTVKITFDGNNTVTVYNSWN